MRADSGERRAAPTTTIKAGATVLPPPAESEHLPCPRCDSTNTKFCYYNNYNFSQPRHFCKSCRRYWTQGGTLRDIPVGGGTRKNAKRPRSSTLGTTTTSCNNFAAATSGSPHMLDNNNNNNNAYASFSTLPDIMNVKPLLQGGSGMHHHQQQHHVPAVGSFTSLLSNSGGFGFGLGLGVGAGLGTGFEEAGGFGAIGRGLWAFPEMGYYNGMCVGDGAVGFGGGVNGGSNWQMQGGEVGHYQGAAATGKAAVVGAGDCFSFAEQLAISAPVYGLK